MMVVTLPYASAEEQPDFGCVIMARQGKPSDPPPVPDPTVVPPEPTCFHSFAEAADYATKGNVKMPKTASREEIMKAIAEYQKAKKAKNPAGSNDAQLGAVPEAETPVGSGGLVLAYHWEHINYGGTYLFVTGTNPCEHGNISYYLNVMPSGWNDRITSTAYGEGSGCDLIGHFEHGFRSGRIYETHFESAWLEWMNDRTSSLDYQCWNGC
jgi:hypothetical protein